MRVPFQIISKNKCILGIFHIAENQSPNNPTIIMCYGLNGNRVEQHRMSIKLGEECEKNGINLVRFDYSDVGVSEGSFENSLISSRIQNTVDVIEYVKGCYRGKPDIYLIGFSDGAKVAAGVMEKEPENKGIILWNPIVKIDSSQKEKKAGTEGEKKRILIDPKTRKPYLPLYGVKMGLGLLKEISCDSSSILLKAGYKKLFLFGERDRFTKEIADFFGDNIADYPNSEIVTIPKAGHLFASEANEKEVILTTIDFIKRTK